MMANLRYDKLLLFYSRTKTYMHVFSTQCFLSREMIGCSLYNLMIDKKPFSFMKYFRLSSPCRRCILMAISIFSYCFIQYNAPVSPSKETECERQSNI